MSELSSKASALSVISAVEAGDVERFEQSFKAIDAEGCLMLERFLVEAATENFDIFKKEDAPLFSKTPVLARAVLRAWKRVDSARNKLAARMAFETIMANARRTK